MKFQISFDLTDLGESIQIASEIAQYADILEVGTILMFCNGTTAVKAFKEKFPEKTIIADTKIIDRGKQISTLLAEAGADWVTVMAGTSKESIHATTTAMHSLGKKTMLDLIDSNSIGQSAMDAKNLGANALLFHKSEESEASLSFLENWEMVRGNTDLPIFVSAHANRENIDKLLEINPNGIIVGKAITKAKNPAEEAKFFYEKIKK